MSTIEGIRLVYKTGSPKQSPDPAYPFELYLNLRPPEFMDVAFVMMYGGSEEVLVEGKTREALEEFARRNDFEHHPRFRRMEIGEKVVA